MPNPDKVREYMRTFDSDNDAQRVELALRDHDPEASTGMIPGKGLNRDLFILRAWLRPAVAKRYCMREV